MRAQIYHSRQQQQQHITLVEVSIPGLLDCECESQSQVHISQKPCNEAHKTLGIMECPDGNNEAEYERLMKRSNALVQRISSKKISNYEAQLYYNTTYLPSMTYGFAVGSFTKNELEKIEAPALQRITSAMGFTRSMPNAVRYGPKSLGGIGLRRLYIEQGTEKVNSIMRYLRCDRPVSKIIWYQLMWCQRVAGTFESILMDVTSKLPQLDDEKWIVTLRDYLKISKLQIHIEELAPDLRQCVNDEYIMDIALRLGFKNSEFVKINRCRMYLKCTTLSDLCTYDGKYIHDDAMKCTSEAIMFDDGWPTQSRPGPKHREVWKKFLKKLCTGTPTIPIKLSNKLASPMGLWYRDIDLRRRCNINTFVDSNISKVYQVNEGQWTMYNLISSGKYWKYINPERCVEPIIDNLIPSTVRETNNIIWRDFEKCNPTINNDEILWDDYIEDLPEWEYYLSVNTSIDVDINYFNSLISSEDSEIICVSDGGVISSVGAYVKGAFTYASATVR